MLGEEIPVLSDCLSHVLWIHSLVDWFNFHRDAFIGIKMGLCGQVLAMAGNFSAAVIAVTIPQICEHIKSTRA